MYNIYFYNLFCIHYFQFLQWFLFKIIQHKYLKITLYTVESCHPELCERTVFNYWSIQKIQGSSSAYIF